MQAPAEDEQDTRAVRTRDRLEGAVSRLLPGGLKVRVAGVNVFHSDDAPAPDQLACAASQDGYVVSVIDVVAVDDGAPRQGEREVACGVVADPSVGEPLVASQCVGNMPELVWALLWDCAHWFNGAAVMTWNDTPDED